MNLLVVRARHSRIIQNSVNIALKEKCYSPTSTIPRSEGNGLLAVSNRLRITTPKPFSELAFILDRVLRLPYQAKSRLPVVFSNPARRTFSFEGAPKDERKKPIELTEKRYHEIADETLESLTLAFEELVDTGKCHPEFDVMCASGVLTLRLSPDITYVINKQTPNRQIWLSSPSSGPKRYDFVANSWVYLHDYSNMHSLLTEEVSSYLGVKVDFSNCSFGSPISKETE